MRITGIGWRGLVALDADKVAAAIHSIVWWAVLAGMLVCTSPMAGPAERYEYRVAPGDSLRVVVFGEPELSVDAIRVGGTGSIAFPLLGEVRVEGMTAAEVERALTNRLMDGYLRNPRLAVSISGYRKFYVQGAVNRPGAYEYQDGLTIQTAIALAGGLNERASESKITLQREKDPLHPVESAAKSLPVRPGDVVSVGESFF